MIYVSQDFFEPILIKGKYIWDNNHWTNVGFLLKLKSGQDSVQKVLALILPVAIVIVTGSKPSYLLFPIFPNLVKDILIIQIAKSEAQVIFFHSFCLSESHGISSIAFSP